MIVRKRSIIAHHLILTLYGHWMVNDPRGSGSEDFLDLKFAPLGPIHHGRKPHHLQPSREQLREFMQDAEALMNFPVFWIDEAKRQAIADAMGEVVRHRGYTCYACAICSNHMHVIVRIHRDDALTMWNHFAESVRQRLTSMSSVESRLRFNPEINLHHPVISARPYKVFLYTPDDVRGRIEYVVRNPMKEGLPRQNWDFVKPYDGFPFHQRAKK